MNSSLRLLSPILAGLCQATSNQPLAPKIPTNPRPVPAKSHRRASVGAPHLPFLSGGHLCVRTGYTLPQVIKEEKEDEERVGISKSEKREGWKTESEEEKTRGKVQRSLGFSCFFSFSV